MSHQPSVLIIDDLPDNVEVLADFLADRYRLKVASSGPDGLNLIREAAPDLILLDAMMPGMDGYEVCERLKGDPGTAEIPIIFVTARNDAESESRALAAGAVDFIHKPVNRDVVRARVQLQLALKSRERELRQANAALNDANVRLNDLNAYLEQRVEERTQALRVAMFRAEAAHKAKQLFLANVNHELRTPMNAILGLSELLTRHIGDSRFKERVDQVRRSSQQLLGIVNDIIDVADLQAGRIELERSDFTVKSLIGAALETWHGRAGDKGLRLTWEADPALPPTLRGDQVRLKQILNNLVGNAIKFSAQGSVSVRASRGATEGATLWVRFEVADQGIGIDKLTQGRIFSVFGQADDSETRRYGGCGLGLALCKQLADLMGGKIDVDSAPGQGSTFGVTIPLLESGSEPAAGGAERAPPADSAISPQLYEYHVERVLGPLIGLLAANDIGAYILWTREKAFLIDLLGDRAEAFNAAMAQVDYKVALEELRATRAQYPQL